MCPIDRNSREHDFQLLAAATLDQLDKAIEQAAQQVDLDVEINRNGGVLEVEFLDRSKMVINSQSAMCEIWVAAKAGGFHFRHDAGRGDWFDTRDGTALYAAVSQLISQQSGMVITLM